MFILKNVSFFIFCLLLVLWVCLLVTICWRQKFESIRELYNLLSYLLCIRALWLLLKHIQIRFLYYILDYCVMNSHLYVHLSGRYFLANYSYFNFTLILDQLFCTPNTILLFQFFLPWHIHACIYIEGEQNIMQLCQGNHLLLPKYQC